MVITIMKGIHMQQYQQQPQGQQPMMEKNPNGGYLNPSNYGGHWGSLDLTPELLAAAQATGKIDVKITVEKLNSKGEPYIRITAKPHVPYVAPQGGGYAPAPAVVQHTAPQAPVPQQYAAPQAPQGYAPQPAVAQQPHMVAPVQHQAMQPAPVAHDGLEDEIPF